MVGAFFHIRMPIQECREGNGSCSTRRRVLCAQRACTAGEKSSSTTRAESRDSSQRALRSAMYMNPTSSFAGGRTGTQIFAAVSGVSDSGHSLLRAHHDAVIQPLMKWGNRDAARGSSSSPGKRQSRMRTQGMPEVYGLLGVAIQLDIW